MVEPTYNLSKEEKIARLDALIRDLKSASENKNVKYVQPGNSKSENDKTLSEINIYPKINKTRICGTTFINKVRQATLTNSLNKGEINLNSLKPPGLTKDLKRLQDIHKSPVKSKNNALSNVGQLKDIILRKLKTKATNATIFQKNPEISSISCNSSDKGQELSTKLNGDKVKEKVEYKEAEEKKKNNVFKNQKDCSLLSVSNRYIGKTLLNQQRHENTYNGRYARTDTEKELLQKLGISQRSLEGASSVQKRRTCDGVVENQCKKDVQTKNVLFEIFQEEKNPRIVPKEPFRSKNSIERNVSKRFSTEGSSSGNEMTPNKRKIESNENFAPNQQILTYVNYKRKVNTFLQKQSENKTNSNREESKISQNSDLSPSEGLCEKAFTQKMALKENKLPHDSNNEIYQNLLKIFSAPQKLGNRESASEATKGTHKDLTDEINVSRNNENNSVFFSGPFKIPPQYHEIPSKDVTPEIKKLPFRKDVCHHSNENLTLASYKSGGSSLMISEVTTPLSTLNSFQSNQTSKKFIPKKFQMPSVSLASMTQNQNNLLHQCPQEENVGSSEHTLNITGPNDINSELFQHPVGHHSLNDLSNKENHIDERSKKEQKGINIETQSKSDKKIILSTPQNLRKSDISYASGTYRTKNTDNVIFDECPLEITSNDSEENSPNLLLDAPGFQNQNTTNFSSNNPHSSVATPLKAPQVVYNTEFSKKTVVRNDLNLEIHNKSPFLLLPVPLSQDKKKSFRYDNESNKTYNICSEKSNLRCSQMYSQDEHFRSGTRGYLSQEKNIGVESEPSRTVAKFQKPSPEIPKLSRPSSILPSKVSVSQKESHGSTSTKSSSETTQKYPSQSQNTPWTNKTHLESQVITEPRPIIKEWLEDEIVNKILTKNFQRCHELHTPEIRMSKILQDLSQRKHEDTASKKTYVKRYKKGMGKIYKLRRIRKRRSITKPKNSQRTLTCEDVIKKFSEDFFGVNTQKSDPCSYEATNTSYETDVTVSRISSSGSMDLTVPQARLRKALNEIRKDKSLLYSWDSINEYTKVEIKENIEQILLKVYDDLKNRGKCSLKYRKQVAENCVFQDDRLQFKPINQTLMAEIHSSSPRSQTNFKLFLIILSKIQSLLATNTKTTKRQIFYQLQEFTRNQRVTDNIINCISCMLNVGTWELNIVAQKGLVYGNLELLMSSGDKINCNERGMLIPANIDEISEVHSSAYFILVVEKESIFRKLIEEDLPNTLTRPFILITGKGFPDLNTQLFLRKLWMVMSVPVFLLVDADPHGINIMLTYRFGSVNNAHVSQHLTVPKAKWLGVYPSEIQSFNIERRPLKDTEVKKVEQLLKTPFMQNNPKIREELQVFLDKRYKASIEGLFKTNFYLSGIYLERKFMSHDFI